MLKNKKGFTLIELLVVIAIIGLLSTLAVVALTSARQKSRDSKRVSDMKQLQTAMELLFSSNNSYTIVAGCTAPKAVSDLACATAPFTDYLPNAATMKDPSTGAATPLCTAASAAICQYAFTTTPGDTTYKVNFYLEAKTGDLAAGVHEVSPAGLK
jgi:general secretion pathway protein G